MASQVQLGNARSGTPFTPTAKHKQAARTGSEKIALKKINVISLSAVGSEAGRCSAHPAPMVCKSPMVGKKITRSWTQITHLASRAPNPKILST